MNNSEFSYYLSNSSRILYYLDRPDSDFTGCCGYIRRIASRVFTYFARLWNYYYGDRQWYDNALASSIVQHYLRRKPDERIPAITSDVLKLYERLDSLGCQFPGLAQRASALIAGHFYSNTPLKLPAPKKLDITRHESVESVSEVGIVNHYLNLKPSERNPATTIKVLNSYDTLVKKGHNFSVSPKKVSAIKLSLSSYLSNSTTTNLLESVQIVVPMLNRILDQKKQALNAALVSKPRLLFHLHANEFGSGSEWEGSNSAEAMAYLRDHIRPFQEQTPHPATKNFLAKLSWAIWIASSKNLKQFLKRFDESWKAIFEKGHSLLVAGGWKGTPSGHAICLEIIPMPKTKDPNSPVTVTMRLINSGAGLENHPRAWVGHRMKYQTFVEWAGIEIERVKSPAFLQVLAEMTQRGNTKENAQYPLGAPDIYQAWPLILRPTQITSSAAIPSQLASEQNAGLCALRALMMAWRLSLETTDLQGLKIYKHAKAAITTDGLRQDLFSARREKANISVAYWRLVMKSFKKTVARVEKLFGSKMCGEAEAVKFLKTLLPVQSWITQHEKQALTPFFGLVNFSYVQGSNPVSPIGYVVPLHDEIQKKSAASECGLSQPFLTDEFQKQASLAQDPIHIQKALRTVLEYGEKAWHEGADQSLHTSLGQFLSQLPIDEAYWQKACNRNAENAKALIVELGKVGHLFFKTCFTIPRADVVMTERLRLLGRLEIILVRLAKCATGEFIEFHFQHDCYRQYGTFFDYQEDEEMHLLHKHEGMSSGFNANIFSSADSNEEFLRYTYDKYNEGGQFVEFVSKHAPEVEKQVSESEPKWDRLPPWGKNARIHMSAFLPQWLQVLRDINLAMHWLTTAPVARPTTLSRKDAFCFSFKLKASELDNKILVGLTGINRHLFEQYPGLAERCAPNAHRSFELMHGYVSTEPMRKLFALLHKREFKTEKELLTNNRMLAKKLGMTEESSLQHLHLFSDQETRFLEFLEFFTKDPVKIQERDYQILFRMGIFCHAHVRNIWKAVTSESEEIKLFLQYIKEQYARLKLSNQIQPCVFLLQLRRFYRTCFIKNAVPDLHNFDLPELRSLLKIVGISPEETSVIYAELIASLLHKPSLENNDIEDLLVGLVQLERTPIPMRWSDPPTENDVRKAPCIHARAIQQYLLQQKDQVNARRLKSILERISAEAAQATWQLHNNEMMFESHDKRFLYRPLEGVLQDKQQVEVMLPEAVRLHPEFSHLFPQTTHATLVDNSVYSFIDKQKWRTYVRLIKDHLIIEQLVQGPDKREVWVRHVAHDRLILLKRENNPVSRLISRHLVHHFTHWQTPEGISPKLFVRDSKSGEIEYEVDIQTNTVRHLQKKWCLSTPSNRFIHFEDSAYIHEWYDESDLKTLRFIELPRFGLTFNAVDDQFHCEQILGDFYLSKVQQPIPLLHHFNGYLVLNDREGNSKVLIPQYDFIPPKRHEVFEPRAERDFRLNLGCNERQRYHTYTVARNGMLEIDPIEGRLSLALVLLYIQNYDAAGYYLTRYCESLNPYSVEAVKILEQLCRFGAVTGDMSGDACAIRLYAAFLLVKNAHNFQRKPQKYHELLKECYLKFLHHYRSVTAIRLEPKDEKFILTLLLSHEFDYALHAHLKQLAPELAISFHPQEAPEEEQLAEKLPIDRVIDEELSGTQSSHWAPSVKPDLTKISITRAPLLTEFRAFYHLALDCNETERAWLTTALTFWKISTDPKRQAIGKILECVLNNQKSFTHQPDNNPDDTQNVARLGTWIKRFKETLSKLLKDQFVEKLPQRDLRAFIDLTPQQFVLTAEKPPVVSPQIQLSLDPLSPWLPSINAYFTSTDFEMDLKESAAQEWVDGGKRFTAHSRLQHQAYKEIEEDFQAFQKEPKPKQYALAHKQSVADVKKALETDKDTNAKRLTDLEKSILSTVNYLPDSLQEKLKLWKGAIKPVTLDDVIACFAMCKQDPAALRKLNTHLADEQINQLMKDAGKYLLIATYEQQRKRAQEIITKLEKLQKEGVRDPAKENDLLQQLAHDLFETRCYDPHKYPLFLAFEYYSNILLRSVQVERLEQFLSDPTARRLVEMIMGAGKTSVLMPLLSILLASTDSLSVLVVLKSLFGDVSPSVQRIVQSVAKKPVRTLFFDRQSTFTVQALQTIRDDLRHHRSEKESLIVTSRSVQSMLAKFIEQCEIRYEQRQAAKKAAEEAKFKAAEADIKHKASQPSSTKETFPLLRDILRQFGKSKIGGAIAVIDEVDAVLSVLRKLCFSHGPQSAPSIQEIRIISALYQILLCDDNLKTIARYECDPAPNPNAPVLTKELYVERLRRPLAEAFMKMLPELTFDEEEYDDKMKAFCATLPNEELLAYLCQDPKAQSYFDKQNEKVQDVIGLAAQLIGTFLQHTLTRVNNQDYGIDLLSLLSIAIPFLANWVPSRGSQYANVHIAMMYSFQAIIKDGVSKKLLAQELKRLQSQAIRQRRDSGNRIAIENTDAGKKLAWLVEGLNVPLFNHQDVHIELIAKRVNSSIKMKCAFVEKIILPQLLLFAKQISCTPQNLISFLANPSGMSGTIWNPYSMHRDFKAQPEAGIAARTYHALFKNSRNSVEVISEGSTESMLKQLKVRKCHFNVIIDNGGYFKDGTNLEIARKIARFYGTSVAYYDDRGVKMITDGTTEIPLVQSPLGPSQRIVFLDQEHTTGADVEFPRDAVGIKTLGRNEKERDFRQGTWRMRGIERLQRIVHVISKDLVALVKQANTRSISIDAGTTEAICEQLQKEKCEWDVLIDAEGSFGQGNSEERASQIAKFYSVPVMYYSKDTVLMVTDGTTAKPLPHPDAAPKPSKMYVDRTHAACAQFPDKPSAIALKTVHHANEQSSKAIHAVVSPLGLLLSTSTEPSKGIKQDHIGHFTIVNQSNQKERDNFQGFQQQLWDIPQQMMFTAAVKEGVTDEEVDALWDQLRALWVKDATPPPRKSYGTIPSLQATDNAVEAEAQRCRKILNSLYSALPWIEDKIVPLKQQLESIDGLIAHIREHLAAQVIVPQHDGDTMMEQELQSEQELEHQVVKEEQTQDVILEDLETNQQRVITKLTDATLFPNLTTKVQPVVDLGLFMEQRPELRPYAEAFKGILITREIFAWSETTRKVAEIQLFGRYRTPLHFVSVNEKKKEVAIISQRAAGHMISWGKRAFPEARLYNLTLKGCSSDEALSKETLSKVVPIKFLAGESHFTPEEELIAAPWLRQHGKAKMQRLLFHHILAGRPEATAAFNNSVLQRIFAKL